EEQRSDYETLTDPSFPVALNFADLDREIATSDGLSLGGIVKVNRVRSLPNAVQYLLMTGQREAAAKAVVSLLRSPLIDWLDGGIYRSYVPTRPISLEFDKSALMNAEWMGVLAKSGDLLPDETVLQFSQGIFDMLAGSFTQGGFVVGCQVGDETFRGRSTRNSFSPKALRDLLTPEERQIARDKLGLRVEDHQIMTVWAQDPRLAYDVESGVPKVLQKLREGRAGQPQFAGRRQLDIHGYVVARMLEAARVWDDESRLLIADDLFSRLDWFLVGDDVQHTLEAGNPNEPYLGDYLAYADACLQHYLAFGRVDSITKGIKVLKRSRILFESEVPGVWRAGIRSQNVLSPKNSDCPELIDMLRESLTAYAIRLCNTYGRLIRDLQAPSDQQQSDAILLLQTAQSTVSQNSAISRALGLDGAAYFCSALKVSDDRHAVVVGPGAVTKAARLCRRVPRRLVAPALGPVRPLLQKRAAGIYLIVGTQETGPVSENARRS
ncbi:MAG TPA: hypothetical protein PLX06_15815, partial [Fimbriimonadaceae bacterium]|nr:hypothetical protein [Fimbriimonadaceae bacterium]